MPVREREERGAIGTEDVGKEVVIGGEDGREESKIEREREGGAGGKGDREIYNRERESGRGEREEQGKWIQGRGK
jgi:hypothetical protein